MKNVNAVKKKTGEGTAAVNSRLPWLRFFVFFFAYICLYNFLVVNRGVHFSVSETSFTYHLMTFDFGFMTKILPGAIYHLFFKQVLPEQVVKYETVLLIIAYAAITFILARMIAGIKDPGHRKPVFVLCMFLLSGPVTFGVFSEELGMLDSYWMFLAVIFMAVVDNKFLRWIIPALFFVMVLVHFGSLFTYIIFCGLVLLYRASTEEKKSDRTAYGVILAVSSVLAIGLFVYFLKYETSNPVLSMEEFDAELRARAGSRADMINILHYNFAFYPERVIEYYEQTLEYHGFAEMPHLESGLPAPLLAFVNVLIKNVFVTFTQYGSMAVNMFQTPFLLVLALPLIVLCYIFWKKMLKKSEGRLKKFCCVLAMVQFPMAAVMGTLFSSDGPRFLAHAFIVLLAFALYVAYKEKETGLEILKGITDPVDRRLLLCYFLTWAAIRVNTYT